MNRRTFFGRLAGIAAALGIGSRVVKAEKSIEHKQSSHPRSVVALNPFINDRDGFAHYDLVVVEKRFSDGVLYGRVQHGPWDGRGVAVSPAWVEGGLKIVGFYQGIK